MTTLRHNRIAVDQTSGAVQRRAVRPTAIGSVQAAALAKREANAGASRRAGPGATTEKGMKFTGKTLKAAQDWGKDTARAVQAFSTASQAKRAADSLEGTEYEDPQVTAKVASFYAFAIAMLAKCLASGKGLLAAVQAEQAADEHGDIDTSGKVVAHETNTGEAPRSAAELRAEVGDAGRSVVLDHLAAVSIGDPGTYTNPYVVDGLKVERARQHASEIVTALNPERVRQGLDDEVLTDFSQLSFMRRVH